MSDGILSQDEIDALLGGADEGGDEGQEGLDAEALAEVLRVAMEASVEGLGDVLQIETTLKPQASGIGSFGDVLRESADSRFAVEAELGGSFEGVIVFLFSEAAVSGLGNMMLGGEAGDDAPTEESLGGFREAMEEVGSQLASAFATILATNVDVGVSDPVSLENGEIGALSTEDHVVHAAYRVTVGEVDFETVTCVPYEVAERLLNVLAEQMEEDDLDDVVEDEPAKPEEAPAKARTGQTQTQTPSGQGESPGGPRRSGDDRLQVGPAEFADLRQEAPTGERGNIDLLLDVPLQVTVELGRTRMQIRDILELGKGSVVELDKLAGEPVEIFVNGKLIAKGEVVTIDENFGVKITDIVSRRERVTNLQ